jgi:hypothetical protein
MLLLEKNNEKSKLKPLEVILIYFFFLTQNSRDEKTK